MHTPPPHTPSLITLPRGGALSLPHLHLVSLKLTFYTICLFFFHKERERERRKKCDMLMKNKINNIINCPAPWHLLPR